MKKYEKPVVMINEELAEGVYAASGATCYKVTGYGCQQPYLIEGTDKNAWTVHVQGTHLDPGHTSSYREVVIYFNYPVEVHDYEETNTKVLSGNGTNTIIVSLNHFNNSQDNIGLSGLVVKVDKSITDLKVLEATYITNCDGN